MTTAAPQRIGGLIRAHLAGEAGMREMARKGGRAAFSIYGDSDQARKVRAADMVAFRSMTPKQKQALLRRRESQFGLAAGSLTK